MIDTQARQRLVERYPIKRYNCRLPLTRGEELIATLPRDGDPACRLSLRFRASTLGVGGEQARRHPASSNIRRW
jgi:hypothetical protein